MITNEDVLSQAIQNNAVLGGIDLPTACTRTEF